jgi:alpha-tubulin suppressor-like RCC1 family protein
MALDDAGNVYVTGYSYYGSSTGTDYTTVKYDSDGSQIWVARYSGLASGVDEANAIAVDGLGNVYVTGYSYGSGYATIKYDRDGNQLWVARYSGPEAYWAEARAIAVDGSGNIYVTGYVADGAQKDIATVKYDTNGNQVWVARYNGELNYDDEPYAVALDAKGNVYVAGSTTTKACGAILDERYYQDYVVIKYSQ